MTDLTARWNEIVTDVKNGRMASVLTRSADLLLVAAIAAMVSQASDDRDRASE